MTWVQISCLIHCKLFFMNFSCLHKHMSNNFIVELRKQRSLYYTCRNHEHAVHSNFLVFQSLFYCKCIIALACICTEGHNQQRHFICYPRALGKVNQSEDGDSKSTNERGPSLVGSSGSSCRYKRFLSCLGCSSRPSTKYSFPQRTLFQFLCTGDRHCVPYTLLLIS